MHQEKQFFALLEQQKTVLVFFPLNYQCLSLLSLNASIIKLAQFIHVSVRNVSVIISM